MSENTPCLKGHVAFARITLASALFLIATSLVASIFATNIYGAMCICIVNFLAYAWIALGITVMISLLAQVSGTVCTARGCQSQKLWFPNLLMWLQAAALLAGVILMILFITRLTDVI